MDHEKRVGNTIRSTVDCEKPRENASSIYTDPRWTAGPHLRMDCVKRNTWAVPTRARVGMGHACACELGPRSMPAPAHSRARPHSACASTITGWAVRSWLGRALPHVAMPPLPPSTAASLRRSEFCANFNRVYLIHSDFV